MWEDTALSAVVLLLYCLFWVGGFTPCFMSVVALARSAAETHPHNLQPTSNLSFFVICIHIFISANGENKINFMPEAVLVSLCGFLPAVHHHGPRVWRIAGLHPSQEGQEQGGVFGHPVVRPGRELELPHLPLLAGAVLEVENR